MSERGCLQLYISRSSQSKNGWFWKRSNFQKMIIPFSQLKCGQAKIYMMTIDKFTVWLFSNILDIGNISQEFINVIFWNCVIPLFLTDLTNEIRFVSFSILRHFRYWKNEEEVGGDCSVRGFRHFYEHKICFVSFSILRHFVRWILEQEVGRGLLS